VDLHEQQQQGRSVSQNFLQHMLTHCTLSPGALCTMAAMAARSAARGSAWKQQGQSKYNTVKNVCVACASQQAR
jgi:hypothetical protein